MASCPPPTTGEHHPAFSYVQALYRSRELGAAVARFGTAGLLYTVKRSLAAGLPNALSSQGEHVSSDVSHGAAAVAKLVLQEMDTSEHSFTCSPTEEGVEVLQQLQAAVFGPSSLQRSFPECVFLASLAQAAQAVELVTAALLEVLAPSNCLSLYNVAAACGCAPLRRKAHALALTAFTTASQQDANGLLGMEESNLLSLLCSDRLQVGSELDVFRALAAWTECDTAARQPALAPHLALCVRLNSLTLPDLHTLGDHPLVASDRPANHVLAQTVIHLLMGVPLDTPLGHPTITSRRHCFRADAGASSAAQTAEEAAAGERQCGVEGHAGAHATVFEAALCAFAQQRQQGASRAAAVAEASMRRLSVSDCEGGSPPPVQPHQVSLERIAPGSPPAAEAPTPTAAAAVTAGAPAVHPTARVRHLGIGKRVGSRRTLFDMGGGGGDSSEQPCSSSSSAASAEGDKVQLAAAAAPAVAPVAAAGPNLGSRLVGGVTLEMVMSPNHASIRALQQQATAAHALQHPAGWESRKRLRFQ